MESDKPGTVFLQNLLPPVKWRAKLQLSACGTEKKRAEDVLHEGLKEKKGRDAREEERAGGFNSTQRHELHGIYQLVKSLMSVCAPAQQWIAYLWKRPLSTRPQLLSHFLQFLITGHTFLLMLSNKLLIRCWSSRMRRPSQACPSRRLIQ